MNIELYVNKQFDINEVIKMVLKRKDWGKKYTLYSTKDLEVLIAMNSYNFLEKYAYFDLRVNEKNGTGYYGDNLIIYTDREDYTLDFINTLLLKRVKRLLIGFRNNKIDYDVRTEIPYVWYSDKSREQWIDYLNLNDEVEKLNELDIDDDKKNKIISDYVESAYNDWVNVNIDAPRTEKQSELTSSNVYNYILELVEEIDKELSNIEKKGNN